MRRVAKLRQLRPLGLAGHAGYEVVTQAISRPYAEDADMYRAAGPDRGREFMSDTDSFIEEVTEEVRRDRMFLMLKKYGWIGALAVILIVGGAALREVSKAKAQAAAEGLGDGITVALNKADAASRAKALDAISTESASGKAVVKVLQAGALADSGDVGGAVELLNSVATDGELDLIYRHAAAFKALGLQAETLSAQDRKLQYGALAAPGAPLRLLAEEQLALIEVSEGDTEAAIARLKAISQDAEVTRDLIDRASQVIVALGGSLQEDPAVDG